MKELGIDVGESAIESSSRIEALKKQDVKVNEFNFSRNGLLNHKKRDVEMDLGLQRL